jgi:hypothetical protein
MIFNKLSLFMVLSCALIGALSAQSDESCGANKQACQDKANPCKCYCSEQCAPRDKKEKDNPVYVENDPYGNYCYCQQWDKDNFVERCAKAG